MNLLGIGKVKKNMLLQSQSTRSDDVTSFSQKRHMLCATLGNAVVPRQDKDSRLGGRGAFVRPNRLGLARPNDAQLCSRFLHGFASLAIECDPRT